MTSTNLTKCACHLSNTALFLIVCSPLIFALNLGAEGNALETPHNEAAALTDARASMSAARFDRVTLRSQIRAEIRSLMADVGDVSPKEIDELIQWHRAANVNSYAELELLHFEAVHYQEVASKALLDSEEIDSKGDFDRPGEPFRMPPKMIAEGRSRDEIRARIAMLMAHQAAEEQRAKTLEPSPEPRP